MTNFGTQLCSLVVTRLLTCHIFHTCKFVCTQACRTWFWPSGVLGVSAGSVLGPAHLPQRVWGAQSSALCCGYCSNQCHDPDNDKCLGHNRDRRRREREYRNCVRRWNVTSNEYTSNNNMKPERRSSAWKSARNYANLPGPSHVNPPLCLWVHANKVHIRPVVDTPPADNGVQLGEQELIPPHRRSRSNSLVASCSRDTPNSYASRWHYE